MGILIQRFKENPLIVPNPSSSWMSLDVFNCGVIRGEDGLYRMLFRAAYTPKQSCSDLGLAFSVEGARWYVIGNEPVLRCGFNDHCTLGVEDPRIVKWIDGWYYVFATASTPAGIRIGIWRTINFLEWEWVGIPFEWEDKNASILPEPIGGYAYLIHRKAPHMWISRTKDMTLRSGWGDHQVLVRAKKLYPSSSTGNLPTKIGLAGPPIKTPKGWLAIIHVLHLGKEENMFGRVYSLGFIVLDLEDPTKVNYIHPEPILWPQEKYEICGRMEMVVFSCATVDTGGDSIYIYWGGADTVICGGRLMKEDLPMCY